MKTEFFQSAGMTNSEIKVYMALLSNGISDARTVSNLSSVPFGKIYDVLYSLEHRNIVKVQNSSPKKFIAVEPQLGVRNLIEAKEKEIQSLHEQASEVEAELMKTYRMKEDESIFWSVAMRTDERKRLVLGALNEAKKEILIYRELETVSKWMNKQSSQGPPRGSNNIDTDRILEKDVQMFIGTPARNVVRRLLLGGIKKPRQIATPLKELLGPLPSACEIRRTTHIAGSFIVIDDARIILYIQNPINPTEKMATIYIWRRDLGKALKQHFMEMWRNGVAI